MAADRNYWLRDHVSPTGRRDVRGDYDRASDAVQAAFDAHWKLLQVRPRDRWIRPDAAKLDPEKKGGFREFFEFRFKAENVQQRPLGYFGPEAKEFTLLLWAIEKGNKFVPQDAVETCEKRRGAILKGQASVQPWDDDEEVDDEGKQANKAAAKSIPGLLR